MRSVRSLVVAVLASVVLSVPAVVLADGRVALVVGNSTYAHIGRLPNPDNDARDISAALRRLGFEVTTELDADRVVLTEALRAFTRRSAGADVSLVFYAGHGIEMDGVNYLLPVDARLERDVDVRFETVTLDDLLVSTSGASLRLVILDACRNNPLARSMRRTSASRSVSDGSLGDLKDDLLGDETLVAYAAAAGTTAADGRGRNSPYTAALLANLEQPLEIGLLFRRVRAQVLASTNGEQRSHEYHSLVGEHYLSGAPPAAASVIADAVAAAPAPDAVPAPEPGPAPVSAAPLAVPAAQQPASASQASAAPTAAAELEGLFWQSILNSANPAEFEAYLQRFPNGVFSELAQARLVALRAPLDDAFSATAPDSTVATEPGTVFRDCDECPEMVVMAGGGLALGRYEVTVEEYRAFTVATGGAAGARCAFNDEFPWHAPGFPQTERHPVTCVSWDDAQAYLSWLSRTTGGKYRLPTGAEWERAAVGSQPGCFEERTRNEGTCPVGSYGSNAAGLSDMVGNLSEWTEDCSGDDCRYRVLRGGTWVSRAENLHPGSAFGLLKGTAYDFVGFRVARTLD